LQEQPAQLASGEVVARDYGLLESAFARPPSTVLGTDALPCRRGVDPDVVGSQFLAPARSPGRSRRPSLL
jgi:hypothetical protein